MSGSSDADERAVEATQPDQHDWAQREERERLYTLHAELCKALAHPKRLEILDLLAQGELPVEDVAERVGLQSSNVSQHLATLRRVGLVTNRKEGLFVYYRLADSRIMGVCSLLREILMENIRQGQQLLRG